MDAAQALAELTELSAQVECAIVLDGNGAVLGSTEGDQPVTDRLARAATDLLAAAGELHASAGDVSLAEVELEEGGLFVLREGERTIAATTGPSPTAGLVVYDLRTCLRALDETKPKPKPKRSRARKPKEDES